MRGLVGFANVLDYICRRPLLCASVRFMCLMIVIASQTMLIYGADTNLLRLLLLMCSNVCLVLVILIGAVRIFLYEELDDEDEE